MPMKGTAIVDAGLLCVFTMASSWDISSVEPVYALLEHELPCTGFLSPLNQG